MPELAVDGRIAQRDTGISLSRLADDRVESNSDMAWRRYIGCERRSSDKLSVALRELTDVS